jgi:hypothetical protein
MIKQKLIQTQRFFKQNFDVFQGLYHDPRTPKRARWLLWAAIGYTLLPLTSYPTSFPSLGNWTTSLSSPSSSFSPSKTFPPNSTKNIGNAFLTPQTIQKSNQFQASTPSSFLPKSVN